jgi:hypothetical protein
MRYCIRIRELEPGRTEIDDNSGSFTAPPGLIILMGTFTATRNKIQ